MSSRKMKLWMPLVVVVLRLRSAATAELTRFHSDQCVRLRHGAAAASVLAPPNCAVPQPSAKNGQDFYFC